MTEIILESESAWQEFMRANADAVPDWAEARALAENGGLEIGGGAAPLIVVYLDVTEE